MENISRRSFLKTAGLATAGVMAGMADAKGMTNMSTEQKQSVKSGEKVKLACIGIGNRGAQVIDEITKTGLCEIVALCDVDLKRKDCQETIAKFPKAKLFTDFRKLFSEYGNNFEAVTVAIPDFAHFAVCMLAISEGKHVYVEKPMARTFTECELMMDIARRHPEVVTQVGNQGHSEANYFQFKAWKDAGIIKDVYAITAHFNNWRRWYPYDPSTTRFPEAQPIPDGMDYETWLMTAMHHDFNDKYHPGNWRGWYDFGMGAIGDWGAHILDTCHQFLELGLPYEVNPIRVDGHNDFFFPKETTVLYRFASRNGMPPVDVTWYDGENNIPPIPVGYGKTTNGQTDIPPTSVSGLYKPSSLDAGKIIYSKDLTFRGGSHGSTLQIIPEEVAKEMAGKLPEVPESPSNHYANFLLACMGKEETRSPFAVFGPMCQMFCLGVIATRLKSKVIFDHVSKTITNDKFANALLTGMPPRKGWEEYYKL